MNVPMHQVPGQGNCGSVTDRGEEARECSIGVAIGSILVKAARLTQVRLVEAVSKNGPLLDHSKNQNGHRRVSRYSVWPASVPSRGGGFHLSRFASNRIRDGGPTSAPEQCCHLTSVNGTSACSTLSLPCSGIGKGAASIGIVWRQGDHRVAPLQCGAD